MQGQGGASAVGALSFEGSCGQDAPFVPVGGNELDKTVLEPYRVRGTVVLQPGDEGVAHDGEKPRPRLAAQAVEEAVGAQHRLLHYVLRVVIVARQPAREVIGRVEMRQHQLLESSLGLAQGLVQRYGIGVVQKYGIGGEHHDIPCQATTWICPDIPSWPSPQKISHKNTKVPILSGTSRSRETLPGMMSARALKSGALNPMTTSAVTNSSTTGTPFLSRISRGRNTHLRAVTRITLSFAWARAPAPKTAPAAVTMPAASRRRRSSFIAYAVLTGYSVIS